jgi:hypothetical protein
LRPARGRLRTLECARLRCSPPPRPRRPGATNAVTSCASPSTPGATNAVTSCASPSTPTGDVVAGLHGWPRAPGARIGDERSAFAIHHDGSCRIRRPAAHVRSQIASRWRAAARPPRWCVHGARRISGSRCRRTRHRARGSAPLRLERAPSSGRTAGTRPSGGQLTRSTPRGRGRGRGDPRGHRSPR